MCGHFTETLRLLQVYPFQAVTKAEQGQSGLRLIPDFLREMALA